MRDRIGRWANRRWNPVGLWLECNPWGVSLSLLAAMAAWAVFVMALCF